MKRALITGANGFLGNSLVAGLLKSTGYRVRCLVRSGSQLGSLASSKSEFPERCEIVYGALNSFESCTEAVRDVDIVFHLASAKGGAPAEMFLGSSVATKCLLEAIKHSGSQIRLVHCSSFSVYGVADLEKGEVVDENTPLEKYPEKRDTYSYSKWHQEKIVREYHEIQGIPTVILRPGVIYGPGGTPMTTRVGLNFFGVFLFIGGNNILPLTYIDNCAAAFVLAAKEAKFSGEVYNIVDDNLISARQYLSLYRKIANRVRYIRIPYSIMWLLSIVCERYFVKSKGQLPDIFTRYKTASLWKPQKYTNKKLKSLGWTMGVPTETGLKNHFDYLNLN
jgi:nucleoside-diphosphate-sugar epimerase